MKRVVSVFVLLVVMLLSGCGQHKVDHTVVVPINYGINHQNLDMTMNETTKLSIEADKSIYNGDVNWVSSDPKVATVDAKGVVTTVGVGTVIVTGIVSDSTQVNCTVSVVYPQTDVLEGIYHITSTVSQEALNTNAHLGSVAPFSLVKNEDGTYKLIWQNYNDDQILTIKSSDLGSTLYLTKENIPDLQSFKIYDAGDGKYVISPASQSSLGVGFSDNSLELMDYASSNVLWSFKSFNTNMIFPVDLSLGGWTALTYTSGHNGTDYSAIDINRNSPSYNLDKGAPVHAVQDGIVVKINLDYGQVHIKHSIPLTIKNGTVYHTWYSTYDHMSNISVKVGDYVTQGEQIGKISNVSVEPVTDHLHFSLATKLAPDYQANADVYYKQFALSPTWIGGDYDSLVYVRGDDYTTALTTKILRDINQAPDGN